MGLIEGSNPAEGPGDFNFDDLVKPGSSELSSTDSKLSGFKKTELFTKATNILSTDPKAAVFYDAKRFAKLEKNDVPEGEKVLAAILLEKEGQVPRLFTRAGEAELLDQRATRIHQEADDGTEVVRTFERGEIIIGSLTNEQYARIHNAAMANLTVIARQSKELNSKDNEVKMKELLSRRDFRSDMSGNRSSSINKFFQDQAKFFSDNQRKLEKSLERLAFEERTIIERKTKKLDKEHDQRTKMRESIEEHKAERNEDVRFKEFMVENDI
jgi:hypothetical protein